MNKLLKLSGLFIFIGLAVTLTACKTKEKKEKNKIEENKEKTPPIKKKKKDVLKIIEKAPEEITATSVLENYFKAVGGKENIKKVKTVCFISTTKSSNNQTFEYITKYAKPNKEFMSISEEGKVFSIFAFDGKKGYNEYEGQKNPFTKEETEMYKKNPTNIFPEMTYKNPTLLGIAEVKDKKAYVLSVQNQRIYFDVETGFKILQLKVKKIKEKEKIMEQNSFEDYKKVNNIFFPFKMIRRTSGLMPTLLSVNEVFINQKVSDKDFN